MTLSLDHLVFGYLILLDIKTISNTHHDHKVMYHVYLVLESAKLHINCSPIYLDHVVVIKCYL